MVSRNAKMKDKGQVTVPVEMRRKHDLAKGARVIFEDRGDYIAMIPTGNLVDQLAGALSDYAQDDPVEIDREKIWTEIATERWERSQKQADETADKR